MNQQHARRAPGGGLFDGLPVERRELDIDGKTTSVFEGGEGPSVVLLHGGIQAGGLVWWRALRPLLGRHRLVVPDLPGLGESEPLPMLDAAAFTGWLAALLRLTCEEQPGLVAHSAPGGLAARAAAQHGVALRQLVLVDAAGLGAFRPSPKFLAALVRANVRPSARSAERFLSLAVADLDRTRAESGVTWEAFVTSVASRSAVPTVKHAMRQLVKAGTKRLTDEELARIDVPTSLLWGRLDPLFPLRIAEAVSATHGWPLRVIDDAGHLPHVEQPEAFVDALTSVIK